jgi:hypothetical protein
MKTFMKTWQDIKHDELAERQWMREAFAEHQISQTKAMAWICAARGKDGRPNSAYWFNVSWTPGVLTVTGDIGDANFTHRNALNTFDGALKWLKDSDFEYLMGKSSIKKEINKKKTIAQIVEIANQDALFGQHSSRFSTDVTYRHVVSSLRDESSTSLKDMGLWFRIYQALEGNLDLSLGDLEGERVILHARGRRLLKKGLAECVEEMSPEQIAQFCHDELGIDDYYGTEDWPTSGFLYFSAIKKWAAEVSQSHKAENAVSAGEGGQRLTEAEIVELEALLQSAPEATDLSAEAVRRHMELSGRLVATLRAANAENEALRKLLPGELVKDERRLGLP